MPKKRTNTFFRVFKKTLRQILLLEIVRHVIASLRYFYFVKICRRFRTYDTDSKNIVSYTIPHNIKGLKNMAVIRSNNLIRPLSIIHSISRRISEIDLLTIGPRSEGEILNLVGHGFSLKKIKALDLISYSPWVDMGDMHEMPYKKNSFDVIISGWVLSYSKNRKKAAKEIIRVARNGAIIAVGVSNAKYDEKEEKEFNSVKEILNLFGNSVDKIFFSQDQLKATKKEIQYLLTIFSIKK